MKTLFSLLANIIYSNEISSGLDLQRTFINETVNGPEPLLLLNSTELANSTESLPLLNSTELANSTEPLLLLNSTESLLHLNSAELANSTEPLLLLNSTELAKISITTSTTKKTITLEVNEIEALAAKKNLPILTKNAPKNLNSSFTTRSYYTVMIFSLFLIYFN